jgi:hypothetical protein
VLEALGNGLGDFGDAVELEESGDLAQGEAALRTR